MESIEVSAKTVEDAVLEAAIQLGTTRDKVAYEVITQPTSGFLGIGGRKAVIRAHQKSDEEIEANNSALISYNRELLICKISSMRTNLL